MFEEDVISYMLHTQTPLSIVENEYFRAMFNNLKKSQNLKHMSRRSLCRKIMITFETCKETIKTKLSKTDIVCTATDESNNHKRFMGTTVHWIDAKTFKRKSTAFACRRFDGIHSYDRIASLLESINNEYGLTKLPLSSLNGSNFVKVFKEYGL